VHAPDARGAWTLGVPCVREGPVRASEAGPAAGFRTEPRTPQTHNVVMSLPGDLEYSPLWSVHVYDRAAFDRVHDASSATAERVVEHGPAVNRPIVWIGPVTAPP